MIKWIAQLFTRKPAEPLKPGICECGHERCCHERGIGRCTVGYPADNEWPDGAQCACKVYIFDPDADDGDDDGLPAPSPDELESLYSKPS